VWMDVASFEEPYHALNCSVNRSVNFCTLADSILLVRTASTSTS